MSTKNKYDTLDPITEVPEYCTNPDCKKQIKVMAYRGTGVCGINCQKVMHPEPPKPRY